jgi:ABC-type polysaccharide/polyol phosphate export permease
VISLCRSLAANRLLLRDFVVRDLKARYVGSSMGFFWSVIFPIVNLLVYMFVFRLVLKVRWTDQATEGQTALVMLMGILVWVSFAETVSRTTNTLVENANLIQKIVFPSEVLPAYLSISSLVNMLIGLPVVLLGVLYLGYISPSESMAAASGVLDSPALVAAVDSVPGVAPDGAGGIQEAGTPDPADGAAASTLKPLYPHQESKIHVLRFGASFVLLPLLLVLQALFTLGLGYFLAAFNLFLRDTYHLIGVFITVWMFATPIFYPAELVQISPYAFILDLNPMYWLIESYRSVILYGDWPSWALLGRFGAVGIVLFFIGSRFFMQQKARFPDLL